MLAGTSRYTIRFFLNVSVLSDQYPRLQEGDERGHFPEAVQEVSFPPENKQHKLRLCGLDSP